MGMKIPRPGNRLSRTSRRVGRRTSTTWPCSAARDVFESGAWSRLAPVERKKNLVRLAELMQSHADELALLETLDMGKPITGQHFGRHPAGRGLPMLHGTAKRSINCMTRSLRPIRRSRP